MIYRHGDLCIKSIKELPQGLKKLNHNILAEGEVTRHAHKLIEGDFTLYEDDKGTIYFRSETPVKIDHEEHGIKEIADDFYIVEREREFDPFEEVIRRTQD